MLVLTCLVGFSQFDLCFAGCPCCLSTVAAGKTSGRVSLGVETGAGDGASLCGGHFQKKNITTQHHHGHRQKKQGRGNKQGHFPLPSHRPTVIVPKAGRAVDATFWSSPHPMASFYTSPPLSFPQRFPPRSLTSDVACGGGMGWQLASR